MMFRRRFVSVLAALLVSAGARAAGPVLDFVHLSDTHVTDLREVHPAIAASLSQRKDTAARLEQVLRKIATEPAPAFVLITGDLVDGYAYDSAAGGTVAGPVELFKRIIERSKVPVFPLLGNHDITRYHHQEGQKAAVTDQSVAAEARAAWQRAIPQFRENTYYAFRKQVGRTGYLFLALDDGEAKGRNRKYAAAQAAWMKRQIDLHPRDAVIVALHVPLEKAPFLEEVQPVLAAAPNVVLSIAGHRHQDGVEEVDLGTKKIPQVRTAALFGGEDNWRRFRLCEDRIEVSATGKPGEIVKTISLARTAAAGR